MGGTPPSSDKEEARAWVEHLQQRKPKLSTQRLRQHFARPAVLCGKTLGRPQVTSFLSWPRDPPCQLARQQAGTAFRRRGAVARRHWHARRRQVCSDLARLSKRCENQAIREDILTGRTSHFPRDGDEPELGTET